MPVNNLASPRHNWENPRDLYIDDYVKADYLDRRKHMATIFNFCPECGINLAPVIKQLKKDI